MTRVLPASTESGSADLALNVEMRKPSGPLQGWVSDRDAMPARRTESNREGIEGTMFPSQTNGPNLLG